MAEITAEQSKSGLTDQMKGFLSSHRLMVLATGGPDGAPSVSTVLYHYDASDIVVSSKSFTAHSNNVRRLGKLGFVVNEGHGQLIVYGRAELIVDDPERLELTKRVFRLVNPNLDNESDADILKRLDEQKRTVIRITPERGQING